MAETEISAYSTDDLIRVLGLSDPSIAQVQAAAKALAARMEVAGKPQMATFFKQAEEKVVKALEAKTTTEDAQQDPTSQLGQWWEYQYLQQQDQQQGNLATDRREKVQMFDDTHNLLKRERLGVRNTIPLPIAQGDMNPTLRNLHTKMVLIDSQFRETIESVGAGSLTSSRTRGVYNSTDYTVDLSEPLRNVISIEIWQVQVPVTWYAFSCALGNTTYTLGNQDCVRTIQEGNYTLEDILSGRMIGTVDRGLDASGRPKTLDTSTIGSLSSACAKDQKLYNGGSGTVDELDDVICDPGVDDSKGATNPLGAHTLCFALGGQNGNRLVNVTSNPYVFYRPLQPIGGGNECGPCHPNSRINQNLGWSLGFRPGPDGRIIAAPGVAADAAPDLFGPKYFVVVLDDFNNNRPNQGIVSTINSQRLRKMPPYATQPGFGTGSAFPSRVSSGAFVAGQKQGNAATGEAGGLCRYKKRDPRRFTIPQLYTMNAILDERGAGGPANKPADGAKRVEGPTASDSLCIVPLDGIEITNLRSAGLTKASEAGGTAPAPADTDADALAAILKRATLLGAGAPYTKFGNQLQARKREYFGPVNIDRVRVKLVDDKGQPVDLNGLDWVISLNVDMVYQY